MMVVAVAGIAHGAGAQPVRGPGANAAMTPDLVRIVMNPV